MAAAEVEYEGFVHRVEAESLLIVFSQTFHEKHPDGSLVTSAGLEPSLGLLLSHTPSLSLSPSDTHWAAVGIARLI